MSDPQQRCFFQLHLPDARVVRLKLAPDCPLIHLFQHPRVGLPDSTALNDVVFTYGHNNVTLQPEKTPQDYNMGVGDQFVNVVFVHKSSQQSQARGGGGAYVASSPPRQPQQQQQQPIQDASPPHHQQQHVPPASSSFQQDSDGGNHLQQLKQQQARHQREIDHLRSEYQNQIDTLQTRVSAQQNSISSLQERNRQLQSELLAAEQNLQNKRAEEAMENSSLLRELSQLQEAVSRAEASSNEGGRWKARYEQQEKAHVSLKSDFAQLQEVCRGYRDQLDRRVSESSDLRSEYDALQRENEQLTQEAAMGSQFAVRLTAQQEKTREKRDQHRALILDLQNQQNVLSEQLSATRAALEREVNTAAEYRASLESAVRDLKEARGAAEMAESRLEGEIASRRAVQSQMDHEKRRRTEERDSLTKEVGELELSLRQSQRRVSTLEEELRVATSKALSPVRNPPYSLQQQFPPSSPKRSDFGSPAAMGKAMPPQHQKLQQQQNYQQPAAGYDYQQQQQQPPPQQMMQMQQPPQQQQQSYQHRLQDSVQHPYYGAVAPIPQQQQQHQSGHHNSFPNSGINTPASAGATPVGSATPASLSMSMNNNNSAAFLQQPQSSSRRSMML